MKIKEKLFSCFSLSLYYLSKIHFHFILLLSLLGGHRDPREVAFSYLLSIPKFIKPMLLLVKAMVFPVVMYGRESWTIKKAEHWRIDAFELWCWRRLLSPLEGKEIQPVHLKEISPGCSLEGLMKLKLQYFIHLMWRADSLEKDPNAGKGWRQEKKGMTEDEMVGWHHRLHGHEFG